MLQTKPTWQLNAYMYDPELEPLDEDSRFTRGQILSLMFLRQLHQRLHVYKKSLMITGEGEHRSGKSVFFYTLGGLIDPTFRGNPGRVVKNARELLDQIEDIRVKNIHGAVIIVDEAGASLYSGDWFTQISKAVVKVFTVCGKLNPCIIMIAPLKVLLNSSLRKMAHYHVKLSRPNNKESRALIYRTQFNSLAGASGTFYHKHPIVSLFGQRIVINSIKIGKPPKDLLDEYRAIEDVNKPLMMQEIRTDAENSERKQTKSRFDYEAAADGILANPAMLKKLTGKRSTKGRFILDAYAVARELKVPVYLAQLTKKAVEAKYDEV